MESTHYRSATGRHFFWLGIIGLAITEVLLVSLLVDAKGILANNSASKALYYAGDLLKLLITSAAVFGLFVARNLGSADAMLAKDADYRRMLWTLPLQIASFIAFISVTRLVFSSTNNIGTAHLIAWLAITFVTGLTFALVVAPFSNLIAFIREQKMALVIAVIGGFLVMLASLYSRVLWEPLSTFTMHGGYLFLELIYDDLFIDAPNKLLGAKDFIVHVSPQCSGIDGMVLALGITAAYLYFSRKTLSFPKAFLLLPIATILALIFNVLRVAFLVAIGASISPEIAVEGFHSVAGWIASILIAMLIIFVFSAWSSFQTEEARMAADSLHEQDEDEAKLATAILLPFVLFLAATIVARIFTNDFDYLYPVKVIVAFVAMLYFWSRYQLSIPAKLVEPIVIGIVVAVLWVLLVPTDTEANSQFGAHLSALPVWAAMLWIGARLVGFWIFAPVVEELVFRGYLLNRISGVPLSTRGRIPFSVIAFVVTSVLFGLIHAHWIAGGVAGALFAFSRYRSETIMGPIIAHASANITLGVWAIATQDWMLL